MFHARAPAQLTSTEAAEKHMAVLQTDGECPELPADVAQAALDEAEEAAEEPPPARPGTALVPKKRPAGAVVEIDEEDPGDQEAFDELERELVALSGKTEGVKGTAKDGYLERVT